MGLDMYLYAERVFDPDWCDYDGPEPEGEDQ